MKQAKPRTAPAIPKNPTPADRPAVRPKRGFFGASSEEGLSRIAIAHSLTPVGTDTLSDRVYERLARALMTGEFRPGASITLREAAQHVGTSVMPVREAVRRLMAQHALILQRNKAIQIPLLSDGDFDQLWHLRALLEGEACAQAAPLIDASEFAPLATLVTEALSAAKAQDMRPIIIKAHEFLFRIYKSTRNSVLVSMIEMLWLRTGPLYYEALSSVSHLGFIRKGLRNNARLLDAIRARDAQAARETREKELRELAAWLRDHRERGHSRSGDNPGASAGGPIGPSGGGQSLDRRSI